MHIAFFAGLKFAGGLHFETSFSHLGLRYLSLNGQYFVEFLFVKMPLNGVFSFESFKPASSIVFYLQWVLSICAYYTLISWLSTKVAGFFKLKTTNISSENTAN
jgi:hypothetical protein